MNDIIGVGRITPAGDIATFTGPTFLGGLAAGPDGNLWYTNCDTRAIGRITPAGVFTEFPSLSLECPESIATGPDGHLWVTDSENQALVRVSTTGAMQFFFNDPLVISPGAMTAGPDGSMWFKTGDSDTGVSLARVGTGIDVAQATLDSNGGTVSTGTTTSPINPVTTSLQAPLAGGVQITESPTTAVPPVGYLFGATDIVIEAPAATTSDPLELHVSDR